LEIQVHQDDLFICRKRTLFFSFLKKKTKRSFLNTQMIGSFFAHSWTKGTRHQAFWAWQFIFPNAE
jgi:hypothetical protein